MRRGRGALAGANNVWWQHALTGGLLALVGCASNPQQTIVLTTGGETSAQVLTAAPTPVTIEADILDSSGNATVLLGEHSFNGDLTLHLGADDDGVTGQVEILLRDAADAAVLYGRSIPVELGAIDPATMQVFVQRIGATARMPAQIEHRWESPLLMLFDGQYLVAVGGTIGDAAATVVSEDAAAVSDAAPPDDANDEGGPPVDAASDAVSVGGDVGPSDGGFVSDGEAVSDATFARDAASDAPNLAEPTLDAARADATTMDMYDLYAYGPVTGLPALPFVPTAIAQYYGTFILFGEDAGAYISFSSGGDTTTLFDAPDGGQFSEVARGSTIASDNGTQYIVGATRLTGPPTTSVLVIAPSGDTYFIHTTIPRVGAAATWLEGVGLVIAGGAPTGAGIELFPELTEDGGTGAATQASLAVPQPYDPDSTFGGAAAPIDGNHLVLLGGVTASGNDPGIRTVVLPCSEGCVPIASSATLPVPLLPTAAFRRDVFATSTSATVVVGDDATGRTRLYELLGDAGLVEIPTKVPRDHARAVPMSTSTGGIAIVGGDVTAAAPTVESFVP